MIRTAIVYLLLIGPSFSAQSWKPINKISQVPPQVKNLLNDCFLVTDQAKAWLNGDNLALIDLGDGNRMWFSTCERSASQQLTAIVIETSQGFHRAKLSQFIDGKIGNPRDNIPAASWHNSAKTLKGRASGGCAGASGARWTWKWMEGGFSLLEQAESDSCIGVENWPVVYQAK